MREKLAERPILFSGEMVRALLDGRKTQTRRALKPQPGKHAFEDDAEPGFARFGYDYIVGAPVDGNVDQHYQMIKCPYGKPGDQLWVRETHAVYYDNVSLQNGDYKPIIKYKADYPDYDGAKKVITWKPSIHMPRWASRITLEITDVRVERLQDISEEDARDEGCWTEEAIIKLEKAGHPTISCHPSLAFKSLWDSINAKRGQGWDANPWLWVIEFKVLEGNKEEV